MSKKTTISIIIALLALALIAGVVLGCKRKQEKATETEQPAVTTDVPSTSQTKSTTTKNNLPVPNAPCLSFLTGAKPFIQITWNWDIADYFNVYRATNPDGPWEKIITNFPKSAHTAVDYNYPKATKVLYYRITSVDKEGNESKPSIMSSVRISAD